MNIRKQTNRNDLVWSQFLSPGMVLAEGSCPEVAEVSEEVGTDNYGYEVVTVAVLLALPDGTCFERTYPRDFLVPTLPRMLEVA